jgi:hypothetical protein
LKLKGIEGGKKEKEKVRDTEWRWREEGVVRDKERKKKKREDRQEEQSMQCAEKKERKGVRRYREESRRK